MNTLLEINELCHSYPLRTTLQKINLKISEGILFAILGPNGSGKTTLFRILSTLMSPESGQVKIGGYDLAKEPHKIREILGVVFQSPSLDDKLTVRENLVHQGHIYGIRGSILRKRIEYYLNELDIESRATELVGKLSGGLKRRVELARSLLNDPKILLLDEPTTGLDPSIRSDFWNLIQNINKEKGVSVIYTTHLFDEAEKAEQVAIFDKGRLVALDKPITLKKSLGEDIIILETSDANLEKLLSKTYPNIKIHKIGNILRLENISGIKFLQDILNKYGSKIESITLSKPSLEDVFIHRTGKEFV